MANIGTLLKGEISRISRKEIRQHIEPVRKASATHRREIAALKRQVLALQRTVNTLARQSRRPSAEAGDAAARPLRFVAKGLASLRTRLGLSAPELARLVGVSGQTVYNWERKKSVPRKEQLQALANLRAQGKREVRARLEAMG